MNLSGIDVLKFGIRTCGKLVSDKIRKFPPIETVFVENAKDDEERAKRQGEELRQIHEQRLQQQQQRQPPVTTYKNIVESKPLSTRIEIEIGKGLNQKKVTEVNSLDEGKIKTETKLEALEMPTTQETIDELKRRLAKELYRIELDLQGGARIANRPCDCLTEAKHTGAVQAAAEELMSYEKNPTYGKIVDWFEQHKQEFTPAVIATKEPDYYRSLTPEVRTFRKEVMGTEKVGAMFSTEEKDMIKKKAAERIGKEID